MSRVGNRQIEWFPMGTRASTDSIMFEGVSAARSSLGEKLSRRRSKPGWYSHREEPLDGLTKLSPTARKAQSPAVKLELSKSPVAIKTENDGTTNRVTPGHTRTSGKARDVGFNYQYLTQYVKSLETDTVSMIQASSHYGCLQDES